MKLIETVDCVLYLIFLLFKVASCQNQAKIADSLPKKLRFVPQPVTDEEVERQFLALKTYRHNLIQYPPVDQFNKRCRKDILDDLIEAKGNLHLLLTVHNKLKYVEENGHLITNTNVTVWDSYGNELKWKHIFQVTAKETSNDEIGILTRKVINFKESVLKMWFYNKNLVKMARAMGILHDEVREDIESFNFDPCYNSKLYYEVLLDPEVKELTEYVLQHL